MLVGGPEGGVTLQLTRCVHCFRTALIFRGAMPSPHSINSRSEASDSGERCNKRNTHASQI